jgi:hypothetical protein
VTSAAASADTFTAPDFAEPIEAWRVWRVVAGKDGWYGLGSIVKPTLWPAGEPLAAECLRTSPLRTLLGRRRRAARLVPDERCECGIYGAGLDLLDQYLNEWIPRSSVARVLGEVSLWGKVIECERGFRASHAYPLRIFVPVDASLHPYHRREDIVAGLSAYGVPVEELPVGRLEAIELLRSSGPRGGGPLGVV